MNAELLLTHYHRIADAPDAVAQLRQTILNLAVRGKLVPQDPSDEPADELLKRIAEERNLLVKQREIRFEKPLIPAKTTEFPFEIPQHWVWSKIGNVVLFTQYGTSQKSNSSEDGVPILTMGNIQGGRVVFRNEKRIPEKSDDLPALYLQKFDILYNRTNSAELVGKTGIYDHDYTATFASYLIRLRPSQKWTEPYFINLAMNAPEFRETQIVPLIKKQTGQANVNGTALKNMLVPLPPLAEQHRIVAKVDELMALCDQLEAARVKREAKRDRLSAASLARLNAPDPDATIFADHARFALNALPALTTRPDQIKQLRQTILNLAVRGKLVPQDPSDEPADELLKRIAEERNLLVKQREIRFEKPLIPAKTTEFPFEIPQHWVWSKIGNVVLFTQYGTSQKSNSSEDGVPILTMGNIQGGRVVFRNEKRIPEKSDDLPALYLQKFDILYNRTNSAELVGKTGIYDHDYTATFASYLIRLRPSQKWTEPYFINLAMNAPEFRETQIVPLIKKQTGQANVNGTALKNMLVPLPPLAEQYRIVAKVDELMALCDRLETSLTTAADTRCNLLNALLAEALAHERYDRLALEQAEAVA